MNLQLDGWRGSDKVLQIIDLFKTFGDDIVLAGINLTLWHSDRVGLIGPNGAGKSVLFRCIAGRLEPTEGIVKIGPSVKTGLYTQEHQNLDYGKTLVETVREIKPMYEDQAVAFLGRFLFPYQKAKTQTIGSLSGGERSRIQLALLMLQEPNFLLLDEPTNNLDIQSAEVLEQVLDDFEGAIFVISHDRYFLDKVVDVFIWRRIDDGIGRGKQIQDRACSQLEVEVAKSILMKIIEQEGLQRWQSFDIQFGKFFDFIHFQNSLNQDGILSLQAKKINNWGQAFVTSLKRNE